LFNETAKLSPKFTAKKPTQNVPGVLRQNNAVVPKPRRGVVNRALLIVLLNHFLLELLLGLQVPLAAGLNRAVLLNGDEHASSLLAAHDRDLRIGPRKEEPRTVCPAAHAVISGAEAAAEEERDFGHLRGGDCVDHFRAVFGDSLVLVLLADHEAGDVLQKEERSLPLRAQLDEVGALQGGLAEEDPVVRDDSHLVAEDRGEPADQRLAVVFLVLLEPAVKREKSPAAVHDPRDDVPRVHVLPQVRGHDVVEVLLVEKRLVEVLLEVYLRHVFQVGDYRAADLQRLDLVVREVVGQPADAAVGVCAAQHVRRDDFAGRRLHERRPAQENRPVSFHDHVFVAHGGHVGAARSAGAQDERDLGLLREYYLGDAHGRHVCLVEEDSAEVLFVGEDFVLARKAAVIWEKLLGSSGVDQVNAGKVVFLRYLLGSQVLFHRDGIVGSAFASWVVCDYHAESSADDSYAGYDSA
jgi:hypothetical protein